MKSLKKKDEAGENFWELLMIQGGEVVIFLIVQVLEIGARLTVIGLWWIISIMFFVLMPCWPLEILSSLRVLQPDKCANARWDLTDDHISLIHWKRDVKERSKHEDGIGRWYHISTNFMPPLIFFCLLFCAHSNYSHIMNCREWKM